MQTHRFYLAPEEVGQASRLSLSSSSGEKVRDRLEACPTLRLGGREAHHALHVLRLKPGDAVTVLDGAGKEFSCAVENCSRDAISLAVNEKKSVPPPVCAFTLLVGIPKGKIIEDIIQKAVELGVRRVVPLLTERVVTRLDDAGRESKREHWQQVAIEAIKQCGAAWLPEIATPTTISALRTPHSAFDLALVGSLQTERRHPREVIREFEKAKGRLPKSVAVWIGPEGDFTLEELQAIETGGAQPISLGHLTLRVETAAIYCLSILNYELNCEQLVEGWESKAEGRKRLVELRLRSVGLHLRPVECRLPSVGLRLRWVGLHQALVGLHLHPVGCPEPSVGLPESPVGPPA